MPDPASPPQSPAPAWLRIVLIGITGVCVAVYAEFLATRIASFASSSDSSGYFNNARLLGRGEFFTPPRLLKGHSMTEFGEMAFQPLGFRAEPKINQLVPTYPIGLPLHLLAASWIVGWNHAAVVVNLITALASGALLWALARSLGLPEIWAGVSVAILWLCPLFLFCALQPMSDALALGWSLAALYCALRARDSWRWALVCGMTVSVAILIRPTNALLVVPVLVGVGFRWTNLFAVALGGLPGAAVLAFYNRRAYGSPFTTGYGDISPIFGLRFMQHNVVHFAHWIPTLLSPIVILALVAPFIPQTRKRGYAVLAAWFFALTGFYVFYFHSGETWWYLRFILPGFPALILAALTVLVAAVQAARLHPMVAAIVAVCVLAFACNQEVRQTREFDTITLANGERNYPDAAFWAEKNLPANSAIFCMQVSGAFFFYSDFLLIRWDVIEAGQYDRLLTVLAEQQKPVYAALFEYETPAALEKIGGQWTKRNTIGQVTFWQRQP